MVEYSQQAGLRSIFKSMLGFEVNEMIIREVPEQLDGRAFSEAALYYPRAVPLAIMEVGPSQTSRPSPRSPRVRSPAARSHRLKRSSSCALSEKSECIFCPSTDAK